MKKNKKRSKESNKTSCLILDDIHNSGDPEVKGYLARVMKEEMSRVILNTPQDDMDAMERAAEEATERATARYAWRFKDKLSPQMQQILEEQYPAPDVA